MKVDREELLGTLKLVKPALAAKEILEHSTCFVFQNGNVVAYNDEIALSHPTNLEIEGAVAAEELLKLLEKIRDKEINIEVEENELHITSKRTKAGIVLEHEIRLPTEEISKPHKWKPLPENFSTAIDFCRFSASKNMAKPLLTCLHITNSYIESCDNFRLTRFNLKGKMKGEVLLPCSAAEHLRMYDPTEYCLNEGWGHFRNEDQVVFSARVYEGEYPDLTPFTVVQNATELTLPAALAGGLEKAGIFSASSFGVDQFVNVTVENGAITVRGEGKAGWLEERFKIKARTKKPITFAIHPEFLKQALSKSNLIEVSPAQGKLKMYGDGWCHVLYLVQETEQ